MGTYARSSYGFGFASRAAPSIIVGARQSDGRKAGTFTGSGETGPFLIWATESLAAVTLTYAVCFDAYGSPGYGTDGGYGSPIMDTVSRSRNPFPLPFIK